MVAPLVPGPPTEPTEAETERERYEPFYSIGIIVSIALLVASVFALVEWLGWSLLFIAIGGVLLAGLVIAIAWAFRKTRSG